MAAKSTTRRRTLSGARTLVALIGFLMVGQLARAAPQPEALNPGAARATPLSTPRTALRVAVMPTLAPTLASDQRELLTRLLAIQLERAGFTVVGAEGCGPPAQVHIDAGSADPSDALAATPLPPPAAPRHTLLLDRTSECLATAGAMAHVDLVALAEHAHLGDADIVTVHIYDVARGLPSRDALSSAALGDAAPALASLVDRLVARALLSFPPSEQPAIRERYEQAALGVCGDARRWFFCTGDGASARYRMAARTWCSTAWGS